MKSTQVFKLFTWSFLIYACILLWCFIVWRPRLLMAFFGMCLLGAFASYYMMRGSKKAGL